MAVRKQDIEQMNAGTSLEFRREDLYECLAAIQSLNQKYAYDKNSSILDRHWVIDTMSDMNTKERSIYVIRRW